MKFRDFLRDPRQLIVKLIYFVRQFWDILALSRNAFNSPFNCKEKRKERKF